MRHLLRSIRPRSCFAPRIGAPLEARSGPIDVALLFAGGAQTALLEEAFQTLTSALAAEVVRILGAPTTVPLHFEG
jgi:hypothetical protein